MGVVSKSAIKSFLNKKGDNHKGLKKVSRKKIMRLVQTYSKRRFLFKTVPDKHQLIGMLLLLKYKGFLLFYDMGLGKSKTFLDAFGLLFKNNKVSTSLVVVENILNVSEFSEQVIEHTDFLPYQMTSSKKESWEALSQSKYDVFIIHYAGLVALLTSLQEVKGKKKSKRKRKRKLDIKQVKKLSLLVQMVYVDESHNAKNRSSMTTRVLYSFCGRMLYLLGGSGTPMGKNPEDFYSQFLIIDRGKTLGTSLNMFREVFCKKIKGFRGHIKWEFDDCKEKQLHRILQNRSLWYEDHEVQNLPGKVDIRVPLALSKEAEEYYATVEKGLIKARGNVYEVKNSFMRLWQITSGFLSWDSVEGDEYDLLFDTAKMQWLREFILSYSQSKKKGGKVVIFHHFTITGRRIEEMLESLGVEYASVRGEIKNKSEQKLKFKEDASCRVLVANHSTGRSGLNLQVANKTILFDIPLSLITFKQMLKRTRRRNQTRRCYFWYLLSIGTIDKENLESLQAGEELFSKVVKGGGMKSIPRRRRLWKQKS